MASTEEAQEQEAALDESIVVDEIEVEDEVLVTIGDEPPEAVPSVEPEQAAQPYKTYRDESIKLGGEPKGLKSPEPEVTEAGEKPDLEALDYDTDIYEQKLEEWFDRKRKSKKAATEREAESLKNNEQWQQRLDSYGSAKLALKAKDFAEAEAVVAEALDLTQQGIIVQGADNSALVIYALGKNPARAKKLSAIKDPVKFAFAVAKLEKDLKMKRRTPPAPEKRVNGSGTKSGATDSALENLRAKASETGDYTKVVAYKRNNKL